jgi:hypothetical protein
MTQQDFEVLRELAPEINALGRVGALSPLREGEGRLFPRAVRIPRWKWDLNRPSRRRFDVLVAANVFMYSPDPARWFRNVLASCRWFLLVDPVRRRRSEVDEFGTDGDGMRFAVGSERPRIDGFFDLGSFGDRLLAWRTYYGGANPFDDAPLHVVALIRGDLGEPVLRIDDYPTGVRPILDDMSPLHDILERVEAYGLTYFLGIVPALVRGDMASFLRSLSHMVPAMHGFNHCYPKYSRLLTEVGDPYNQKTLGVFNEFEGKSYAEIVALLSEGRARLAEDLGTEPRWYIPPCNKGDRRTGKALQEVGFEGYLSEKRIPGCSLPWHASDFCGRSSGYDMNSGPDVVTLHLTWEWDLLRSQNRSRLDGLLASLASRRLHLDGQIRPLRDRIDA